MLESHPYFLDHFYWIEEGHLAGASAPLFKEIPSIVVELGIRRVLSLVKYTNPRAREAVQNCWQEAGAVFLNIPIMGGSVPNDEEREVLKVLFREHAEQRNGGMLVHCEEGNGRTGVILALYLMDQNGLSAQEAFDVVRIINPRAFDSQGQIDYFIELGRDPEKLRKKP